MTFQCVVSLQSLGNNARRYCVWVLVFARLSTLEVGRAGILEADGVGESPFATVIQFRF